MRLRGHRLSADIRVGAISGKRLRATGGPGPLHCYVGWRCMVWRAPLAAVAAVSGPPVASIGQKLAEVCVICFC